ncbi:MAG: hypothetical protein WA958_15370 [Tunicatimonas sp.]
MHLLRIASAVLFSGTLALAQDVTFSDYTSVRSRYDLFIIGGNEQGVFTGIGDDYYYNGFNNKQVVSYHDFAKGQQASKVLKPEKKSREYFYSFYFQDQLHLLQYDDKPDDGKLYGIYLESYDNTLTKVGEEREISQLYPYIFSFNVGSYFQSYFSSQYGKMRRSFFYNHKTSDDGQKLALLFNYNFFGNADAEFHAVTLNENLEEEWAADIQIPDAAGSYHMLEDYAVGNDGKLYLLVATFDNQNFKKTAVGFEYLLYAYDPANEAVEEVAFETNGKFIINLGMQLDQNQQPVLAGVYADATTNDILGGVRIAGDQCAEFAFEQAEVSEINTKQDKNYAEEYTVKNTVLEEDGSVVFFAESYKRGPILKPKLGLGGLSPIDTDLEMGDIYRKILAVKINPSGEHWLKIVDKTQRSSEERDVLTSFAFTHDEQGYYLLFNNKIKNMTDVSLVTITPKGDIDLKTLFGRSKFRLRAVPAFATSVAPGLLTLPVEKSRKQAIATLTF